MSPNERERAYARKRYNDWQERQAKNAQKRRQQRNALLAGLAALAVIATVVGVGIAVSGDDPDPGTAAATPNASSTVSASTSPSMNPSAVPCPEPTRTASGDPQQWPKAPDPATARGKTFQVVFKSNCGTIAAELDGDKAPQAVASTVFLARSGFYDGVTCHRMTTERIFVLQCGDPLGSGSGGPGYSYGPIENAPKDGVYPEGTVAMARLRDDGKSMGSQFFLVYKDSPIPSDAAGGYTVMGRITEGMETIRRVVEGGALGDDGSTKDGRPNITIAFNAVTVTSK